MFQKHRPFVGSMSHQEFVGPSVLGYSVSSFQLSLGYSVVLAHPQDPDHGNSTILISVQVEDRNIKYNGIKWYQRWSITSMVFITIDFSRRLVVLRPKNRGWLCNEAFILFLF